MLFLLGELAHYIVLVFAIGFIVGWFSGRSSDSGMS